MTAMLLDAIGVAALAHVALFGLAAWLLCTRLTYPTGDTCSLLAYSRDLREGRYFQKNYVFDFGVETDSEVFRDRMLYFNYNLSLNLMRLFPERLRLRGMRFVNLGLLALTVAPLWAAGLEVGLHSGLDAETASYVGGCFALLLAGRTRLLGSAALIHTIILNLLLFCILLLALAKMPAGGAGWPLLAGFAMGLSVRNRQADILQYFAAFPAMLLMGAPLSAHLLCLGGFALATVDMIHAQLVRRENAFAYLHSLFAYYIPNRGSEARRTPSRRGDTRSLFVLAWEGLRAMFNPFSSASLFVSQGGALALAPYSLVLLMISGKADAYTIFLLLICFVYLGALSVVRQEGDQGSYFSGRQTYIILPALTLLNVSGAYVSLQYHNALFLLPYVMFFFAHGVHQLFRLLDYHFRDEIVEPGLLRQKKIPENYRRELACFLKTVERPAVILGVLLFWGAAQNFFQWGKDLRAVHLYAKADDKRIAQLIDRHGVTHVVMTWLDFPLASDCTLRTETLSPTLAERLELVSTTPNLRVWRVIARSDDDP